MNSSKNAIESSANQTTPLAVTVNRAAELTGLGLTTIWNLIRTHRLKVSRVGRRTLVVYSSLEDLLAPKAGS